MTWPVVPLENALNSALVFVDGDWVESKDQDPDGDVRLIQLADIGDGYYVNKSNRFLTSDAARRLKCTFLETGDLLIARMPDPLGRACIFPGDSKRTVTVVDVCIIRPDSNTVHPPWLMHCINSPQSRNQIDEYTTGTTRQRISRGNLAKIKIALPPLEEQRRIAAILDQAETLRTQRRTALALLDGLTQSLFLDMFGDPVVNPKGWEKHALQTICEAINDCPHSTPEWTESGMVCLRTSNLTAGDWDWRDTRYVSEDTFHERSKRGYLRPGDIVLSREGTVGIAAIVQTGMALCMGQRLVQLRPDAEVLAPGYLLRHLLYVLSPSRISQLMVGSTSQHLNVKELRALQIPLPPLPLQQTFATRIACIEALKASHRHALTALDALFASLQQRAFAGQL
ncbi:restriction endonuclease subunit S [Acidovorax kalamii]|uniref:Type I restriction modification DNA specificity domain-containing protein n=1 Tax=Acidovorax kalamii TaxID=2004485 RepID=A0A235EL68_9BURK|nr:restriction endonuclease subunit S [Acidovorax kalamii]OYD49772.1 hypothetical protein CBY09_12490 [Acidovorax kalamii]